ncbi:MAG: DUF3450 domain-containing protein [Halioglobus sp.]|nr:DUF3450 domain-containing protein [Halioglobus sp.]
MTKYRLKEVLISALITAGTLGVFAASVHATTLDSILAVGKSKNDAARNSQVKIDRLADETRDLLSDYKTVTKQVDGLKVYNARLQRQIDNQTARIAGIEADIDKSTVIARQIPPLVPRMLDGLEAFIKLDMPFEEQERLARVQMLRSSLDRDNLDTAEIFRAVLEAYNIELQYGRTINTYRASIDIGGTEREVDFLQVGRVALAYQTTDGALAGAWDNTTRSWVQLPSGDYSAAIKKGIAIVNKQATTDLLKMPIAAPEAN